MSYKRLPYSDGQNQILIRFAGNHDLNHFDDY